MMFFAAGRSGVTAISKRVPMFWRGQNGQKLVSLSSTHFLVCVVYGNEIEEGYLRTL